MVSTSVAVLIVLLIVLCAISILEQEPGRPSGFGKPLFGEWDWDELRTPLASDFRRETELLRSLKEHLEVEIAAARAALESERARAAAADR